MASRSSARPERTPATVRRLERSMGTLSTAATARMDADLPWYRALRPEDRSWVSLVAQAGIAAFVEWLRDPRTPQAISADVFGTAPRELTRSVTLQQTVDLVRVVIAVVEERVDELAAPGEVAMLRESMLRYSREVAFAAAQVYAQAAEARGAWDARLEALVVDALLRDEVDDAVLSRAAALGWGSQQAIVALAGALPAGTSPEDAVEDLRRAARAARLEVLAGVQGERLVAVLGGSDPTRAIHHLLGGFGPGPVVVGPAVTELSGAGTSAAAAVSALRAAPAWPDAPRPVNADELLPERALAGDATARRRLVDDVYRPLVDAGPTLAETLSAYLEQTASLEATARLLFVHPNTVRYRLRRVGELTGWSPSEPRHAFVLRVALVLGRLDPNTAGL